MSRFDQVMLVHAPTDESVMDLANPLMGPFDKVSTLRVADDDSGMQDLTSRITLAMIDAAGWSRCDAACCCYR